MVEILLDLVRATQEGNWQLHLSSVPSAVPWCFTYEVLKYASYLLVYIADMANVPAGCPEVQAYFESGGLAIQNGSKNTSGKITMDQTIEETANKGTQTADGTKGFSLKSGAVTKVYISAEGQALFLRELKNMAGINSSPVMHTDQQPSGTARDEADVMKLAKMLETS